MGSGVMASFTVTNIGINQHIHSPARLKGLGPTALLPWRWWRWRWRWQCLPGNCADEMKGGGWREERGERRVSRHKGRGEGQEELETAGKYCPRFTLLQTLQNYQFNTKRWRLDNCCSVWRMNTIIQYRCSF